MIHVAHVANVRRLLGVSLSSLGVLAAGAPGPTVVAGTWAQQVGMVSLICVAAASSKLLPWRHIGA